MFVFTIHNENTDNYATAIDYDYEDLYLNHPELEKPYIKVNIEDIIYLDTASRDKLTSFIDEMNGRRSGSAIFFKNMCRTLSETEENRRAIRFLFVRLCKEATFNF